MGLPDAGTAAIGFGLRIVRMRRRVDRVGPLPRTGRCSSCGRRSVFLTVPSKPLEGRIAKWPYDEATRVALTTRENYHCLWCGRNYRIRGLAAIAARWIDEAQVFEPAIFGVFSAPLQRRAKLWVSSSFVPGREPGTIVQGVRHEDLQNLSFSEGSFDLAITSEVFEHIESPWVAFKEVRRVLRAEGRHVFTVPHVAGSLTTERAGLPAVLHIDPKDPRGIPVVTDFGDDLPDRLQHLGFDTRVHELPSSARCLLRVYESRAV